MVSYISRLEYLIEKWQSRRKTIEISQANLTSSLSRKPKNEFKTKGSDVSTSDNKENENLMPQSAARVPFQAAYKQICQETLIEKSQNEGPSNDVGTLTGLDLNVAIFRPTSAACPCLLYVSIVVVGFLCCFVQVPQHAAATSIVPAKSSAITGNGQILDVSKGFADQFYSSDNRERWTNLPDLQSIRLRQRPRPPGYLTRTLSQIRNRIGARNTIRVHNAFRDFMWRILSGLSMPTPVIYELRRQNFYSPDDEMMNDSLHNKNTTKTIRSRRLMWPLLLDRSKKKVQRSSDDDDDEPENFRDRVRMRLEDLVNLSRRSLFGRVIRIPSLFPFKRQEEEEDDNKAQSKTQMTRGNRRRRLRRRRNKEVDRQLITINGKQYYVDDEGELKELNDNNES